MAHTKDQLAAKYQSLAAQEPGRVAAAGGDVVRFNELVAKDLDALRGREDARALRNEVNQAHYDSAMKRQDAKGGESSERTTPLPPGRDRKGGATWLGGGSRKLPPSYATSIKDAGRKRSLEETKDLAAFQSRLRREEAALTAELTAERDDRAFERVGTYSGGSAWGLRAKVGPGGVKITSSGRSTWANGGVRGRRGRAVERSRVPERGADAVERPRVGVRINDEWWAPVDLGSYYDKNGRVVTRPYEGLDLGDSNFPRGNGRFQGGVLDPAFVANKTAELLDGLDPSDPGYERAAERARHQANELQDAGFQAFRSWARWKRTERDRDERNRRLTALKTREERTAASAAAPAQQPISTLSASAQQPASTPPTSTPEDPNEAQRRQIDSPERSGETLERSGETLERSGETLERSGETLERSGETLERSGELLPEAREDSAPLRRAGAQADAKGGEARAGAGRAVANAPSSTDGVDAAAQLSKYRGVSIPVFDAKTDRPRWQQSYYIPADNDKKLAARTQAEWAARGVGGYLPSAAANTEAANTEAAKAWEEKKRRVLREVESANPLGGENLRESVADSGATSIKADRKLLADAKPRPVSEPSLRSLQTHSWFNARPNAWYATTNSANRPVAQPPPRPWRSIVDSYDPPSWGPVSRRADAPVREENVASSYRSLKQFLPSRGPSVRMKRGARIKLSNSYSARGK